FGYFGIGTANRPPSNDFWSCGRIEVGGRGAQDRRCQVDRPLRPGAVHSKSAAVRFACDSTGTIWTSCRGRGRSWAGPHGWRCQPSPTLLIPTFLPFRSLGAVTLADTSNLYG